MGLSVFLRRPSQATGPPEKSIQPRNLLQNTLPRGSPTTTHAWTPPKQKIAPLSPTRVMSERVLRPRLAVNGMCRRARRGGDRARTAPSPRLRGEGRVEGASPHGRTRWGDVPFHEAQTRGERSEEHTSELQSRQYLV